MNEQKEEKLELEDDVKLFIKAFKIILIISILILVGSIFQVFFSNVKGNINLSSVNDKTYNFEKNILYNSDSLDYNSTFNLRNETIATELYNGSYTFSNDVGSSIGWIDTDNSGAGCTAYIIENSFGHDKVVRFNDTSGNKIQVEADIPNIALSTIEFWFLTNNSLLTFSMKWHDGGSGGTRGGIIRVSGGDLDYYDGAWKEAEADAIFNNTWYHLRFDYDCTANGYLGLGADEYWLTLNGQRYPNPLSFENPLAHIDTLEFESHTSQSGYFYEFDAVSYEYDLEFNVGDNTIPVFNQTSNLEVANDEIAFNVSGQEYTTGAALGWYNGWSVVEDDDIFIVSDIETYDKVMRFEADDANGDRAFKEYDNIPNFDTSITEFSVYMTLLDINEPTTYIRWYGEDSVGNNIFMVRIYYNSTHYLFESMNFTETGYDTQFIVDDTGILDREFHLYFVNNLFTVQYYDENGGDERGYFRNTYIGNNPLYKITFDATITTGLANAVNVDSFGLKVNGTSRYYVNDYALSLINTNITNWNSLEHNLVEINGSGIFAFGTYSVSGFSSPRPFYNYSAGVKQWNIYDYPFDYSNPLLAFMSNSSININSILIHGVKITQNLTEYWLVYTSSGVDIDESYFYCNLNSDRLFYTMTTDDTDLEFIQAQLNIEGQQTTNYSLRWGGRKFNPYLSAEFRVNYYGGTLNSFYFRTSYFYTNEIIAQEKIIINFALIVSDNDNDISGSIEGFIEPIVLYYNPGASLDIVITNYINIIPGIALISVITLVIWIITKKKVGNMLIIPSIALTSFLAYISTFIPLWLLFTILVSCGVLLFSKWKDLFMVFNSFTTMILGFLLYAGVIDLWVFYGSFLVMVGWLIFSGIGNIRTGSGNE